MDLSQLSDADLQAISNGDISKVSDEGLQFLAGSSKPSADQVSAVKSSAFKQILGRELPAVAGIPEAAAHLATAPIGYGVGGVAGIAALGADLAATGAEKLGIPGASDMHVDPEAVRQRVMHALTYDPVTAAGNSNLNPLVGIPKAAGVALSAGPNTLANAIEGDQSDPWRNLGAATVREAGPALLAYGISKGAPLVQDAGNSIVEKVMGAHLRRAGDITREALGTDPQALAAIQAQADAGNPGMLTASQAAGPAQNPEFAALQNVAAAQKGVTPGVSHATDYSNIDTWQQGQRNQVTNLLAGGNTQEASIAAQRAGGQNINARLDPLRETALDKANIAGDNLITTAPELAAARKEIAVNKGGYFGEESRANAAATLQAVEDKIGTPAQYGLQPLSADPILGAIDEIKSAVGDRADKGVVNTLNAFKSHVQSMADLNGGHLNAFDLHTIRKTGINDAIDAANAGAETATKLRIAANLQKLKPVIDQSIEDAGGPGWTKYLNKFAFGKQFLDRQSVARAVQADPSLALDLGAGNAPATLEKILGPGNTSLSDAVGPDAHYYRDLSSQLQREGMLSTKAKAGTASLSELINDRNGVTRFLPNWLNPKITIMNELSHGVQSTIARNTMDSIAQGMKSPQNLLELWNRQPITADSLQWLSNPNLPSGAAALTPGMLSGAAQQ